MSTAEEIVTQLRDCDPVRRRVMLQDIAERHGQGFAETVRELVEQADTRRANERGRRRR